MNEYFTAINAIKPNSWRHSRQTGMPLSGHCNYDLPGEFLGESVEDKENFIIQPFIDLLAQADFSGAQLISPAHHFRGLKNVHRETLRDASSYDFISVETKSNIVLDLPPALCCGKLGPDLFRVACGMGPKSLDSAATLNGAAQAGGNRFITASISRTPGLWPLE